MPRGPRSYYIHCPVVSSRTDGDIIKARLFTASGDETGNNYSSATLGYNNAGNEDHANVNGGNHWQIFEPSDSASDNTLNMASFQGWIHQPNDTTHRCTASFSGAVRLDNNQFTANFSSHNTNL